MNQFDDNFIRRSAGKEGLAVKAGERRRFSSAELFSDSKELLIEHGGDEYRLRITRQNKLILTK